MSKRRDWFGPVRCGWCITNDHPNCIVLVEMGKDAKKGRPRDRHGLRATSQPPWHCGCDCEFARQSKCVACSRTGVLVENDRCVDAGTCDPALTPERPMMNDLRMKAS